VAAIVVGYWTLVPVPSVLASGILKIDLDAHVDARAIAFAAATAIFSVLLFGIFPAFQAMRQEVVATLKSQGTGGSASRGRVWVRNALVTLQMSISLTLIIATGLLLRTVVATRHLNPGFDTQQQMVIADVAPMAYSGRELPQLFKDLEQRLAALPGVRQASVSGRLPLGPSGGGIHANVFVPGHVSPDGNGVPVGYTRVSDSYFDTMGTRLLRGRVFSSADTPQTQNVVIINQTMAKRFWGSSDPIGQTFRTTNETGPEYRVVGVVQDGKYNDVAEVVVPYMFLSLNQKTVGEFAVAVAVAGDAQALVAPIRKILSGDGKAIVMHVDTMNGFMRDALYEQRVTAQLIGALGVLGVVLAAFGLYGVISFIVGRRTKEIGVRIALGAPRLSIFRMVLKRGVVLGLSGVAIGCGGAFMLGRLMGSMLYGVGARDPLTFTAAAVLLLMVACAATYFPARRATHIEPMEALRYE
jgi:predicted permease